MKRLLLFTALVFGPVCGQEASAPPVREKLRARLLESLGPPPLERPAEAPADESSAILVLPTVTVSESKGTRELAKWLANEKQREEAEAFSAAKGGAIYRSDRLELGGWWSAQSGWHFIKLKW